MTIAAYYHPGYAAPIGEGHVMPITKFSLVADGLRGEPGIHVEAPAPLTADDVLRVHTRAYVDAVRTGEPRPLAESQKFTWSPQLYPSVLLTGGGLLAAARRALTDGVAAAVVSGFHHAHGDHGEGFCTFNSLVVAAELLHAAGAQRIAVLDMDVHYGNGTASLAPPRPYFFTMSIYGSDYDRNTAFKDVDTVRHTDGANHQSIALPNGSGRDVMLAALEDGVRNILAWGRPDIVLYQAGADPYREDPYSPLALDHDDLRERDRRVFAWARDARIPIAWVLAGGYTKDTSKVVRVHLNTFDAAREVFG